MCGLGSTHALDNLVKLASVVHCEQKQCISASLKAKGRKKRAGVWGIL